MPSPKVQALAGASALTLALSACGGTGDLGQMVSSSPPPQSPTPSPKPTPTPTPTPLPPAPLPTGAIGLQSSAPFAVYGWHKNASSGSVVVGPGDVQLSYSASDNLYTVTLPTHQPGQFSPTAGVYDYYSSPGGWTNLRGTTGDVKGVEGASLYLSWPGSSDFKYTSIGSWSDTSSGTYVYGSFAYGIPTALGDVPLNGSATYDGSVGGTAGGYGVGGSVSLSFDFGAGSLTGVMKPVFYDWDAIPLGDYVFRDTVYSTGATKFSGAFQLNGAAVPSSFEGSFTGPQAAELMASWTAPYSLTGYGSGTMYGVWIAKKP